MWFLLSPLKIISVIFLIHANLLISEVLYLCGICLHRELPIFVHDCASMALECNSKFDLHMTQIGLLLQLTLFKSSIFREQNPDK